MALKTSPHAPDAPALHHIHANPQATRVEFRDLGGQTWRGDGGNPAVKQAVAYRLAACWNVLEGVPTSALMRGWVRELVEAIDADDFAKAKEIAAEWNGKVHLVNGLPHTCKGCGAGGVTERIDETEEMEAIDAEET